MNSTKIVYIGAGSMSFGISMFRDLFTSRELKGSTLCLVDINQPMLERMAALAQYFNQECDTGIRLETFTDFRKALPGSEFVVNSTAIDRNRLWRLDFEIPKKYGIRHTLGENGGPGGLFFTMRTIPLVFDFIRAMEKDCPQAYFINYSNPESRIILAVSKYSNIRCIGLCHGIFMAQDDVSKIIGLPVEQVDVWGAGLNHFQWLLHIRHHESGRDLYPLLKEKEIQYDPTFMPLTRRLFHAFGKYPTCSDDHLGEYLAYGWEAGEEGYNFDADEQNRVQLATVVDDILNHRRNLPEEWLTPSGECGGEVITGIIHNKKTTIPAGVVYNQGTIPNLPADLAVEVPVWLDSTGIHPISLGPLPDGIAKLLLMQASIQQKSVESAVHASKELALQALLIDPVVNSTDAAVKILDELWEVNRKYIRSCI